MLVQSAKLRQQKKKCIHLTAISIGSTGGKGTSLRAIKYNSLVKKPLAFFPLSADSTEMNLKLRTRLFGKRNFKTRQHPDFNEKQNKTVNCTKTVEEKPCRFYCYKEIIILETKSYA